VLRHVVVERSVDAACTQAKGNGAKADEPETARQRDAEYGNGGEQGAQHRHFARTEPLDDHRTLHARQRSAEGGNHRDDATHRQRKAELIVNSRPSRTEQRVGQTKADESDVDDEEQEVGHFSNVFRCLCLKRINKYKIDTYIQTTKLIYPNGYK